MRPVCIFLLCLMIPLTVFGEARIDMSVEDQMIVGTVTVPEAVDGAQMTVSAGDDAVFTEVNGESIKRRKRSGSVETDLAEGQNTFVAEWYAEDVTSVRVEVRDADGKMIAQSEYSPGGSRNPARKIILGCVLGGAACWGLGFLICRRRNEKYAHL